MFFRRLFAILIDVCSILEGPRPSKNWKKMKKSITTRFFIAFSFEGGLGEASGRVLGRLLGDFEGVWDGFWNVFGKNFGSLLQGVGRAKQ